VKASTIATALALVLAGPALAEDAQAPAAAAIPAAAQPGTPTASDLLFDYPSMKNTAPGSTLTYDYLRRSGIEKGPFGAPLKDTITLKVAPGKQPDGRDIQVEMFNGMNRRPAGPYEDMTGNPIVSLFLENHLQALSKVLEANPRYLKLAIRRGLRERATVTPMKVTVGGKEVDGWRIVTQPFVGDPLGERMRGMDDLTYTFVTSPAVPGEIVSMEAASKSKDGGELLEEKLGYEQKAG
jgi:hypothetical protein